MLDKRIIHHANHEKINLLSELSPILNQVRQLAIELGPSKEGVQVVELGEKINNIIKNLIDSLPDDLKNDI
ncbi:MAG: hypothetical protein MK217_05230 [Gammaproteobacteria bacterium]|nr:hypothetical protein [Gammaproteobacteria bacterium]